MSALWAWFLGTRVGRYAAGVLAIAAVALLKTFSGGRAQQKASQTADKLKAISGKRISDEKVDSLGLTLCAASLVSGCVTAGDFRDVSSAIRPSRDDCLTEDLSR